MPAQLALQVCLSSFPLGFVSSGIFTSCLIVFCSEKSSVFTQHSFAMYGSLAQVDFILLSKAHGVCHDPHLFQMPDPAVLVLFIRSCPGVRRRLCNTLRYVLELVSGICQSHRLCLTWLSFSDIQNSILKITFIKILEF